jgi:hypothetical protein
MNAHVLSLGGPLHVWYVTYSWTASCIQRCRQHALPVITAARARATLQSEPASLRFAAPPGVVVIVCHYHYCQRINSTPFCSACEPTYVLMDALCEHRRCAQRMPL